MNTVSIKFFALLVVSLGAISCVTTPKELSPEDIAYWDKIKADALEEQKRANPEKFFSYWEGDDVSGSPSITIKLDEQAAYFYKGGQLVGKSRVASGTKKFATPPGSYKITEKKKQKRSNLYGKMYDANGKVVNRDADVRKDPVPEGGKFEGASMPYWMRLTTTGVGMHSGPIPHPGSPSSHGCVRLNKKMAPIFFREVRLGTPVKIVR